MANAKSVIAKTRKFLHRFAPRELSPTRLAEKYGADQKKKGAAKVAAVANASAAKNAAGEEMLARQLETIATAMPYELPPQLQAALPKPSDMVTPTPKAKPNYLAYGIGGALALGALAIFARKRS